jgi:hypothetical protein
MENVIYPRSPRETMAGWVYLPRFIDKIRLHLSQLLHPDYQPNFTKGFDERWLQAAGLESGKFIDIVKLSITDGQVCDWVRAHVKTSPADQTAFNNFILNRGSDNDEARARLEQRKKDAGLAHRADIKTFCDFIDADEKRI